MMFESENFGIWYISMQCKKGKYYFHSLCCTFTAHQNSINLAWDGGGPNKLQNLILTFHLFLKKIFTTEIEATKN